MSGRIMRLAHARLRYSASFDSECRIERNGIVIHTKVPCTVEVPNDTTQQVDGQSIPVGSFLVVLPLNYTLLNGDYVVEKGRQLRIISVTTPKSYQVRTEAYAIDVGQAES
jgi:hypothetical protein